MTGLNLPRFFCATRPLKGAKLELDGALGHQISRVLRLHVGDRVILQDGSGRAWESVLRQVWPGRAQVEVGNLCDVAAEPDLQVTLFASILKGEKQEFLVQKVVELGVWAIQPIVCSRTLAKPTGQKMARWRRIATEAAEQCERAVVPPIRDPLPINSALCESPTLVCVERSGEPLGDLVSIGATKLALWIGPEGGWTREELGWLSANGSHFASLGSRILRAETAAVAALAVIMARVDWSAGKSP